MPWSNDQFAGTLTIPTGATTGARIVLDGTTGIISIYDASNFLVATISPTDGFLTQSASGNVGQVDQGVIRVDSSDWDNAATFSTHAALPIGVSTYLASASNNLAPGNASVGISLDPGDQSAATPAIVNLQTPGTTTPISFQIRGVDQGRGLLNHSSITANAPAGTAEQVAITSGSVTFRAGRAYRIKIKGVVQSTIAGDMVELLVKKTNTGGQIFLDTFSGLRVNLANDSTLFNLENVIINGAGADVTAALVLTYQRYSGTGNVRVAADATNPAYIEIYDIGVSSAYPGANEIV